MRLTSVVLAGSAEEVLGLLAEEIGMVRQELAAGPPYREAPPDGAGLDTLMASWEATLDEVGARLAAHRPPGGAAGPEGGAVPGGPASGAKGGGMDLVTGRDREVIAEVLRDRLQGYAGGQGDYRAEVQAALEHLLGYDFRRGCPACGSPGYARDAAGPVRICDGCGGRYSRAIREEDSKRLVRPQFHPEGRAGGRYFDFSDGDLHGGTATYRRHGYEKDGWLTQVG